VNRSRGRGGANHCAVCGGGVGVVLSVEDCGEAISEAYGRRRRVPAFVGEHGQARPGPRPRASRTRGQQRQADRVRRCISRRGPGQGGWTASTWNVCRMIKVGVCASDNHMLPLDLKFVSVG